MLMQLSELNRNHTLKNPSNSYRTWKHFHRESSSNEFKYLLCKSGVFPPPYSTSNATAFLFQSDVYAITHWSAVCKWLRIFEIRNGNLRERKINKKLERHERSRGALSWHPKTEPDCHDTTHHRSSIKPWKRKLSQELFEVCGAVGKSHLLLYLIFRRGKKSLNKKKTENFPWR